MSFKQWIEQEKGFVHHIPWAAFDYSLNLCFILNHEKSLETSYVDLNTWCDVSDTTITNDQLNIDLLIINDW